MSIQQSAMIPADLAQVLAVLADAEAPSALSGMLGAPGKTRKGGRSRPRRPGDQQELASFPGMAAMQKHAG